MQGGAVAALRDVPACGDVLDALRPSSTGVREGSSRTSLSEPPAGPQGGGLRAAFLAASTRLAVVVEMSGRVFVEEAALIEAVAHTSACNQYPMAGDSAGCLITLWLSSSPCC